MKPEFVNTAFFFDLNVNFYFKRCILLQFCTTKCKKTISLLLDYQLFIKSTNTLFIFIKRPVIVLQSVRDIYWKILVKKV